MTVEEYKIKFGIKRRISRMLEHYINLQDVVERETFFVAEFNLVDAAKQKWKFKGPWRCTKCDTICHMTALEAERMTYSHYRTYPCPTCYRSCIYLMQIYSLRTPEIYHKIGVSNQPEIRARKVIESFNNARQTNQYHIKIIRIHETGHHGIYSIEHNAHKCLRKVAKFVSEKSDGYSEIFEISEDNVLQIWNDIMHPII